MYSAEYSAGVAQSTSTPDLSPWQLAIPHDIM